MKDLLGYKFMLAFEGEETPERIRAWLSSRPVGGFSLFRPLNVNSPGQVRALTDALQAAAHRAGYPPLIIAADQEGGQLIALGQDTTPFPGNMALAAARDADLTRRVGQAMGREMAAMGVNVNYAPSCDLNSNPRNPMTGVRTFGDDPVLTAEMAAAMVVGLQSAGVAATMKHFPGSGEAQVDAHYQMPSIELTREDLFERELRPFQAAIGAGVKLAMSGHFALPAITTDAEMPATLSRSLMHDLLRKELGFEGLTISDALDMGAITQGAGQIVDVLAAVHADVDLLLLTAGADVQERLYGGLHLAYKRGLLKDKHLKKGIKRILALKAWLGSQEQPVLEVVGSYEHKLLAKEAAERSITLVRNDAGLLPLRLDSGAKIAVMMPQPQDLTPADTSSSVRPTLAQALRTFHPAVEEFIFPLTPKDEDVAALKAAAGDYDLLLLGTINAVVEPAQGALIKELQALDMPVVTVALRAPHDLMAFSQEVQTVVCTYSILEPSMQALAAALWDAVPFCGKLPVSVNEQLKFGHGLTITS